MNYPRYTKHKLVGVVGFTQLPKGGWPAERYGINIPTEFTIAYLGHTRRVYTQPQFGLYIHVNKNSLLVDNKTRRLLENVAYEILKLDTV